MMQLKHHKTLTLERWQKFSFEEQIGNIGSEVSRFRSARKNGDQTLLKGAFERALELIDLTLLDIRHGEKLEEIKEKRNILTHVMGDHADSIDLDKFQEYFDQAALRVVSGLR